MVLNVNVKKKSQLCANSQFDFEPLIDMNVMRSKADLSLTHMQFVQDGAQQLISYEI